MSLMQTEVIKLDSENPSLETIRRAARIIENGDLVAFPTETVYGIASLAKTKPLAKLNELKGRDQSKYYTLHISSAESVKDYVPTISPKARKVIQKAWPGPVTIVFELSDDDLKKQQGRLEPEVFSNLYRDNSIGIRCPDNMISKLLFQNVNGPVVAPSANISGQEPATEAAEVLTQLSDKISLVLDGGPCKYKKSSTVVKIGKDKLEILRDGVYPKADLEAISMISFLFVCTGNTCRSPMAEGFFRKIWAEKLDCSVDELDKKGYKLISAGTLGIMNLPPTPEAVMACKNKGVEIGSHKSSALSRQLINESDFIFVMSRAHREYVLSVCPEAADKCTLLAEEKDIPDPIGRSQQVYNDCAQLIEDEVRKRIGELFSC